VRRLWRVQHCQREDDRVVTIGQKVRWQTIPGRGPAREGVIDAVYPQGNNRDSTPFCMVRTGYHREWTGRGLRFATVPTRCAVELSNPTLEVTS
jgi:hypothetical protein